MKNPIYPLLFFILFITSCSLHHKLARQPEKFDSSRSVYAPRTATVSGEMFSVEENTGPLPNMIFEDEFDQHTILPHWKKSYYWCGPPFHPEVPHTGYYSPDNYTFTDSTVRLWTRYQPKTFWNKHANDSVTIEYALSVLDLINWIKDTETDLINNFSVECRVKMPEGKQEWPAFWITGYVNWPPEVDVFEYWKGDEGEFTNNFHFKEKDRHRQNQKKYFIPEDQKYDFHIYRLDVRDDRFDFYFDNFKYRTIPRIGKHLDKFTVIINSGVHDSPDKDTFLEVDWVRVYRL
jgi:hypothetical protein